MSRRVNVALYNPYGQKIKLLIYGFFIVGGFVSEEESTIALGIIIALIFFIAYFFTKRNFYDFHLACIQ